MAPTPEQIREKVVSQGEDKIAGLLVRYSKMLPGLYPGVQMPPASDEAAYRKMAKDVVDKGGFTAPKSDGSSVFISVDDLDQKDTQQKLGIKEALKVKSLKELIPNRAQLNAMAGAVSEGIEENSGPIMGTSFGNLLSGLLKWIVGLFTGESSFSNFKETIAGVTASNMGNSVGDKLAKLRSENPSMSRMLNNDTIGTIAGSVRDEVMVQTGFAPAKPVVALKDTPIETIDSLKLKATIKDKILNASLPTPEGSMKLSEFITQKYSAVIKERWDNTNVAMKGLGFAKKGLLTAWNYTGGALTGNKAKTNLLPTEAERKVTGERAADLVAETLSSMAADTNFRDKNGKSMSKLTPEEFATLATQRIGEALVARKEFLGLPAQVDLSAIVDEKTKATTLDLIKAELKPGMVAAFAQLQPVMKMAEDSALAAAGQSQGALAAAGDARNAGTQGGTHATDTPAQPGAKKTTLASSK